MEILFAGYDDIGTLIRLRLEFFREEPELSPDSTAEAILSQRLRHYYKEHLNRDFFAALAAVGGEIAAVSFLVLHEKPANINFPTGKTGEILNVFTRAEHRRKGYATATLKLLIGKARELGASPVELSASESGRYVYEKLGFAVKPARGFTEMVLRLSPPAAR